MTLRSEHISIPTPCHESWDQMNATACGAFCHSCQREVIDFSTMTDHQVIDFLEKNKSGCGRFREDQLNRNLKTNAISNGWLKWRVAFIALTSLAFPSKLWSNAPKAALVKTDETKSKAPRADTSSKPVIQDTMTNGQITLKDNAPNQTVSPQKFQDRVVVSHIRMGKMMLKPTNGQLIRRWFRRTFGRKQTPVVLGRF